MNAMGKVKLSSEAKDVSIGVKHYSGENPSFSQVYKRADVDGKSNLFGTRFTKIFPNAVVKGDDGFLRIRMEDMFYALVNAVKELDRKIDLLVEKQKEIEALKQEIQDLKKDYSELEKRLVKMEKRSK